MKRKYIAMALIVPSLVSIMPAIGVSAVTAVSIIPYENIDGVETVNLKKLFDALGYKAKQVGNGIEVYINGRKIAYNDSSEYISLDGVDEFKKYINSNGDYLMAGNALDAIGISCVHDGVHIYKKVYTDGSTELTTHCEDSFSSSDKDILVTNSTNKGMAGTSKICIPYQVDEAGKYVDVVKLANAIGEKVTDENNFIQIRINGLNVEINKDTGIISINGAPTYFKGKKFNGAYVLPKSDVQYGLEIKCDFDGVHIQKEADSSGNVKVLSTLAPGNSSEYTPIYDYDLMDYEDAYIDKHNISRIKYDANLANILEQQMKADRQANINEGWHTKDSKFYFLKDGVPITGWYKDDLIWYYFNSDGSMKTGWLQDNGNWYYFYDSGAMAQKVLVNGYYLNESGALSNDVSANAPTGIAYKELINRVRNLGFSHKTKVEADDPYNTSRASEYEFEYYSRSSARSISYLEIRDNYTFSIMADYESDQPDYNKSVYQILQWLLPTQIQEVYSKINANPVAQTIYADGRVIEVSFYQTGINFAISDQ